MDDFKEKNQQSDEEYKLKLCSGAVISPNTPLSLLPTYVYSCNKDNKGPPGGFSIFELHNIYVTEKI